MLFEPSFTVRRLPAGKRFRSRWTNTEIVIERWLGEGANGSVYSVYVPGRPSRCALKLGNDMYALQSELNVLQQVGEGAPKVLLSDDVKIGGRWHPFYIMSFVPGFTLRSLLTKSSSGTLEVMPLETFGERLLMRLKALHDKGWAFGDLKPENVIVSPEGDVHLVDYGGAAPFGESVKQMTEMYDRGFWRAGGRRAEPAYDLFSFAVVMLEAAGMGRQLQAAAGNRKRRSLSAVSAVLTQCRGLAPAMRVMLRMLKSHYGNAAEALGHWRDAYNRPKRRAEDGLPVVWFAASLFAFVLVLWRTLAG